MAKKTKKAQFYIFTSIILCILLFSIYASSARMFSPDKRYDELSSNYINEASNVINHAIYADLDIFDEFDSYTHDFMAYSRTKNTDFKVLYLLKKDGELRIVNYLNQEANISGQEELLGPTQKITIPKTNNITITYDKISYGFVFSNETIEFKALIKQK